MSIKFYNTLIRQKEDFQPLKKDQIGLYTCGPTVYNFAHIGNLRTFLFEDFLRRSLEFLGYDVTQVMNITDVGHLTSDADEGEDKMLKGAKREKKTVWEIAQFYTDAFFADIDALNIKRANHYPKATDHIKEMIALIERLEKNGLTYRAGGNVYFDTSRLKDYGKLARLTVETQDFASLRKARVDADANKKHPHDFVLWFTQSKHGNQDMQWDSPWGRGFPGWHIECSAMSMKYLGEHFDIHCGGIDHISVHHTNEIAQSEGALGKEWVHTWMHGNFLLIKEAKMAKSGENFLTLKSLRDRGFDPLDYRYFCMQAHYSKELMFSWEAMEASKKALKRLRERVLFVETHCNASLQTKPAVGMTQGQSMNRFTEAICDDLNIPQSLAVLWELMDDKKVANVDKLSMIRRMDEVLGLKLDEKKAIEIPPMIQTLVNERNEARDIGDWLMADKIRGLIEAAGYNVKDVGEETILEKK